MNVKESPQLAGLAGSWLVERFPSLLCMGFIWLHMYCVCVIVTSAYRHQGEGIVHLDHPLTQSCFSGNCESEETEPCGQHVPVSSVCWPALKPCAAEGGRVVRSSAMWRIRERVCKSIWAPPWNAGGVILYIYIYIYIYSGHLGVL